MGKCLVCAWLLDQSPDSKRKKGLVASGVSWTHDIMKGVLASTGNQICVVRMLLSISDILGGNIVFVLMLYMPLYEAMV